MNKLINDVFEIMGQWQHNVSNYFPKIVLAIIISLIFIFLAKGAKMLIVKLYAKTNRHHTDAASIVAGLVYFFFLLSGLFIALQVVGLEQMLTKLLAGAGIVGIIAGFAFKDIASNLFAGLLLKMQNPFRKGDWVTIDSNYGYIIEVGWITTLIHTVPGQEVFVPNQLIYSSTFTNYSTLGKRRIILSTGVSYGDDLEHVRTVALDEVKKIQELLPEEGIDFYYTDIGGSSYNFMLRFWIKFTSNDDYCRGMNDAIMRIKKRFEQENISIAYPVTTLDFGVKGGVNIFDKAVKADINKT